MPTSLRVLIVEDSESDAALILRMLGKAGYTVYSETVLTGSEMEAALAGRTWDIVIADYRLPQFDAPAALALLRKMGLDIPFVVVSGTIGEEMAVALMKAGASDYMMKDNLARLAPVVERELVEAQRRQAYRRAEQEMRESEARYRSLFENSPISLWEEDFSAIKQRIEALRAGGVTDFRAYFSSHPEVVQELAGLARVLDVNQATLDLYKAGSKTEMLTGLDKIITEAEIGRFQNELNMIAEGRHHFEFEMDNVALDGEIIEINLNWAAVSGHEEDLDRVIISVQDIRQRKRAERQLRETEARLRSLVEQMPAAVYTELADHPGQVVYISPQIEALSGYAPSAWLDEIGFSQKIVHPDDLKSVKTQSLQSDQTGEPFSVEYRLVTSDGRTVWVRDEAILIRAEDGRALYWQGVMLDITETKQAEAELQESQRHLAQLMNNLPGMAFRGRFTPEWKMDFVSEGSLELIGYRPEQMTGDPEFHYLDMVQPDDLKANWALVNISLAQKRHYQLNYRIRTSSGQEKWVWEHAQGIYDSNGELASVEGFIIDITESKLAEAAIHHHLSELEVLYRNSLAINHLMDPSQIAARVIEILADELDWHHIAIRLCNGETGEVELLAFNQPGLDQAELEELKSNVNKTINSSSKGLSGWVYEHNQPVRCPRVKEDRRYLETNPDIRSGLYIPLRTGERTIGSISVESHLEDAFSEQDERLLTTIANQAAVSIENAQLFKMVQEELAARKLAEAELQQAQIRLEQRVAERTADLKAANLALEKAARLKDEFLASMSHELRTPLTGILGLSEVLQLQTYGALSDKQMSALKHIAASGRQLLDMINDILDFTRIEARQVELRFGPCQLAQICQSSLQLVMGQAGQKNLKTSFSIDPASIVVQADSQRLKQMLANLLNNAVKFTPAGGSIGIEVAGSQAEKLVRITVWDTGIGIRAEDLPHLFQTFVQLDGSLSRQYNGAGLGLALAKRLAELQGGSIKVESTFGVGSRFTINLPWAG